MSVIPSLPKAKVHKYTSIVRNIRIGEFEGTDRI